MTRRRPLAVAVAWATFKDAVAVGATVVQFVVLNPSRCALWGHAWHVWASGHAVVGVCDRCGTTRAR